MNTRAKPKRPARTPRPDTPGDGRSADHAPNRAALTSAAANAAGQAGHAPTLMTRLDSRSPDERMDAARYVFVEGLGGGILRGQATGLLDEQLAACGTDFLRSVIASVKPRDVLEEMLCVQMAWVQARLARLSSQAAGETSVKALRVLHEAADAASNTFRRLMLGLSEYRNPRRGGACFTAIRQQNNAAQQVVQNGNPEKPETTNEQGLPATLPAASPTSALPADARGLGLPAPVSPARESVAVEHRPADGGGQGAGADECPAAWRAVGGTAGGRA